jgi:hypothetical protein
MSRHGRRGRHQHSGAAPRPRPAAQAQERPTAPVEAHPAARPEPLAQGLAAPQIDLAVDESSGTEAIAAAAPIAGVPLAPSPRPAPAPIVSDAVVTAAAPIPTPAPAPTGQAPSLRSDGDPYRPTCTVAQLRRFIKSRPWIPMHELRRRFDIIGDDDDVSPMRVGGHTLFIGLPPAEGRLMAELLSAGDVGYELSLDPITPVVVGVYPMRPVPRG